MHRSASPILLPRTNTSFTRLLVGVLTASRVAELVKLTTINAQCSFNALRRYDFDKYFANKQTLCTGVILVEEDPVKHHLDSFSPPW